MFEYDWIKIIQTVLSNKCSLKHTSILYYYGMFYRIKCLVGGTKNQNGSLCFQKSI